MLQVGSPQSFEAAKLEHLGVGASASGIGAQQTNSRLDANPDGAGNGIHHPHRARLM